MKISKLLAPKNESEITSHWKYKDKVYISCVCITFNQERYVRDTIESMLAQKCDFKFEIVIHDDCSTDESRDIISEYKRKYPSLIKVVFQSENQYSQGKKITPLAVDSAIGDYIAICEGDDFWVSEYKLQKQIEILKNMHGMVYSKSLTYLESRSSYSSIIGSRITDSIFMKNPVPTLTVMIEKSILLEFYSAYKHKFTQWKMLDYPTWLFVYSNYAVVYLDEITSCYRVLGGSASRNNNIGKQYEYRVSSYEVASFFYRGKKSSFKCGLYDLYHNAFLAAWCKKRGLNEYKKHILNIDSITRNPMLGWLLKLALKVLK